MEKDFSDNVDDNDTIPLTIDDCSEIFYYYM